MFIKKIGLTNFLSYGPELEEIELKDLNIIVGPNGSGKSNLFEALSLLRSTPKAIVAPVRQGGGVADWLWKGAKDPVASISFVFENNFSRQFPNIDINYSMDFSVIRGRFEILRERLEHVTPAKGNVNPYLYYSHERSNTIINVANEDTPRQLKREDIDPEASIFAQRKDPDSYPEITHLGRMLELIRIYREWHFGVDCIVRQSQLTDDVTSFLHEDCSNLALVLSNLLTMNVRKALQEEVKNIYDGADEIAIRIESGRALTTITENKLIDPITATRLSDGTLRYLCLMAILLNPNPIPLICIDEPELGLHPDLINCLAKMLKNAAKRTQIIVNTHSALLLDAFSDSPENVIICEKRNGCSTLNRLNTRDVMPFLKTESLGALWMRGDLGGTRW